MQDIKIPDPNEEELATASQSAGRAESEPSEHIKVKFSKFVQLVASRGDSPEIEEVMKNHGEEDIIVNSNLLTDLASVSESDIQDKIKKLPIIFLVGIIIGIIITYLVIQF